LWYFWNPTILIYLMENHLQRDLLVSRCFSSFNKFFLKCLLAHTSWAAHPTTIMAYQSSNIAQILQAQRIEIHLFIILLRLWVHLSPFTVLLSGCTFLWNCSQGCPSFSGMISSNHEVYRLQNFWKLLWK
jgi:hypothetical protein